MRVNRWELPRTNLLTQPLPHLGERGRRTHRNDSPEPTMASKASNSRKPAAKKTTRARARSADPLLVEVGWEVVNQLGGIYTVLRSKIPSLDQTWGNRYCLVGPYNEQAASVEFEPRALTGPFGQAVKRLREWGFDAHYGTWLVTGKPRVVLLDVNSVMQRLGAIKYGMWEHHHIDLSNNDDMMNRVTAFGFMVEQFFHALSEREAGRRKIVGHFHEWMGGTAIPEMRRVGSPVATVFTTHATLLGRYLAMNDPWFYDHLPFVNWAADAKRFNIEAQVKLERAAAHGAHVLTTVSQITADECEHLLGRKVDLTLPNGLNIERYAVLHEFQNLHRRYKERIHQFVMGHFFPSYSFDLENTLYAFTSGRYEYRNKGFDVTVEALAQLNHRLREAGSNKTLVVFFITKRPYRSINAEALRSKAVLEELRDTCEAIGNQVRERLFLQTAAGRTPKLDDLMDEYWRLRLRRTRAEWRIGRFPAMVTHDLLDDTHDELLNHLRSANLINGPEDRVKVIYHPDFITPSNPLFGMDYDDFVRGCHMGIFPSYYEPWGYTPLECVARGIPAITSDLSGFGAYVQSHVEDHENRGIMVCPRRYTGFKESASKVADWMFDFAQQERRDRITLRNRIESSAVQFDWHELIHHYDRAHEVAMRRAE